MVKTILFTLAFLAAGPASAECYYLSDSTWTLQSAFKSLSSCIEESKNFSFLHLFEAKGPDFITVHFIEKGAVTERKIVFRNTRRDHYTSPE